MRPSFTERFMETNENKNESITRPDKKSKSSLREWFGLVGGLLIILLAGVLFAIGRENRSGYLGELGLDLYQVPDDFNSYAAWGFGTGTYLAMLWLIAIAVAMFIYAACIWWGTPAWNAAKRKWRFFSWLSEWTERSPENTPKTYGKYAGLGIFCLIAVYFVWITRFVMRQAYDEGVEGGKRFVASVSSPDENMKKDVQWIELHFGENDLRVERGYRLLCTDKLCSIYDPAPDKKTVRVIPLDGLKEIRVFAEKPKLQQK
jgi:hypothetical protein